MIEWSCGFWACDKQHIMVEVLAGEVAPCMARCVRERTGWVPLSPPGHAHSDQKGPLRPHLQVSTISPPGDSAFNTRAFGAHSKSSYSKHSLVRVVSFKCSASACTIMEGPGFLRKAGGEVSRSQYLWLSVVFRVTTQRIYFAGVDGTQRGIALELSQ